MSTSDMIPKTISYVNGAQLCRNQYLGKGAFGRCYSFKCTKTGTTFAGKFLDKRQIEKCNFSDKISREISIHRSLNHKHIVQFCGCVEDDKFIYIILELCNNRSMSELIKRRKYISSFEAKYYMRQIACAVSYLHNNDIIHRDLKLGNLFINSDMVIKLGDFGLAVKLKDGKRSRRTLCGTPNYIAPEVIERSGHSFEVDIWALGCILYILLVGVPPFQTGSIEETYQLISKCQYKLPGSIKNSTAGDFIKRTLQKDPKMRPSITELSDHVFLNSGFIPKKLPPACCVMPPRTKTLLQYSGRKRKHWQRSALKDINLDTETEMKFNDHQLLEMLNKLHSVITDIILKPSRESNDLDTENPALRPFIWVNSWIDYSHIYGFGYKLNDQTVGALFNDGNTLLLLPSGKTLHYIDANGNQLHMNTDKTEDTLKEKLKVLKSFRKFMFESLKNAYEDSDPEEEPLTSMPILTKWINTSGMVGMYFNNATFQINYINDHIKLILCPIMEAVTVITNGNQLSTYQFSLLKLYGCKSNLFYKLKNALIVIELIIKEKELELHKS